MWTSVLLQQHRAGGGDDNDAEVAPPAANHYVEFSLLLYRWETNSVSSNSPPGCILIHWAQFDPLTLKKQRLIFCCNTEWPLYKLPNGGTWPINGSLNNNTILQLDLFSPNTRVNGQRYLMLRSSFYSKKIIPLQKCKLATVALFNTSKTTPSEFTLAKQSEQSAPPPPIACYCSLYLPKTSPIPREISPTI